MNEVWERIAEWHRRRQCPKKRRGLPCHLNRGHKGPHEGDLSKAGYWILPIELRARK